MRGLLVAAMLVAAALGGSGSPARAGAVGDAVVSVGGWVGEVEAAVSAWLQRLWGRVSAPDREARAADAFRQIVVAAPERLDRLAGRAGYVLSGYAIARDGRQDLVLRFRHDRDLGPEDRLKLSRELSDATALDLRPELTLLRILLDADDWRDSGAGGRYTLSGVEVQVADTVSSRLIFSDPTVTP